MLGQSPEPKKAFVVRILYTKIHNNSKRLAKQESILSSGCGLCGCGANSDRCLNLVHPCTPGQKGEPSIFIILRRLMLPLTILSVTYLIPNVVVNCNVLCQSSPVLLSTFCFSVEDIHDIFVSSNRAKTSGAFSNPQSHNKRPQCHFRFTAFEIKSLRFDNFKIKILKIQTRRHLGLQTH